MHQLITVTLVTASIECYATIGMWLDKHLDCKSCPVTTYTYLLRKLAQGKGWFLQKGRPINKAGEKKTLTATSEISRKRFSAIK